MRPALRALAAGLAAAAAAPVVSGCAPHAGDLGRPAPSIWNETLLPAAGSYVAWARGEKVSAFALTDAEIELRDRAWRFVMPAHERSWFQREVQELARTRIIPVSWQSISPDRYHAALLTGPFRSEYSRYRRLAEDAQADMALIAPFRRIVEQVAAADAVRLKTAALSPNIHDPAPANAHARVAENEGMAAWVRERLRHRVTNYRYALDNLVVELPSAESIHAERAIVALEAEIAALDGLIKAPYKLGPPIKVRG